MLSTLQPYCLGRSADFAPARSSGKTGSPASTAVVLVRAGVYPSSPGVLSVGDWLLDRACYCRSVSKGSPCFITCSSTRCLGDADRDMSGRCSGEQATSFLPGSASCPCAQRPKLGNPVSARAHPVLIRLEAGFVFFSFY